MVCLSRPYHFKFFEGCLPQILLGPLLNTLPHMVSLPVTLNMFFFRGVFRALSNISGIVLEKRLWLNFFNKFTKGFCKSFFQKTYFKRVFEILVSTCGKSAYQLCYWRPSSITIKLFHRNNFLLIFKKFEVLNYLPLGAAQ